MSTAASGTDINSTPTITATVGQLSNSDLKCELTEVDLLEVCRCGGCSVDSLLQDMSCPRPSELLDLALPFLDWSQEDLSRRSLLLTRLFLEYKAVLNKFSKLKKDVCQWITQKRLTFANLSKTLAKLDSFMPSLPRDDKVAELKKAKTFNKLFVMLPDEHTFLDYHLYEDLGAEFQNAELSKKVEAYKKMLDVYCRRKIFECPFFTLSGQVSLSSLVVEMLASHSKMTLQELVLIREQLCGVLSVVSNTFYPINIRKTQTGNIQIIFKVPNYVKDVLPPLNVEQETAMRELGFVGWNFYNGTDMLYDPVS